MGKLKLSKDFTNKLENMLCLKQNKPSKHTTITKTIKKKINIPSFIPPPPLLPVKKQPIQLNTNNNKSIIPLHHNYYNNHTIIQKIYKLLKKQYSYKKTFTHGICLGIGIILGQKIGKLLFF